MQELKFGEHWIKDIGPIDLGFIRFEHFNVHWDTLLTAWLAMGIVVLFSLIATKKLDRIPSKIQVIAEAIMSFIEGISVGQIGKDGKKHVILVGSLFLFIFTANMVGQLPWKLYHLQQGEFAAPTNDINLTTALALIVSIYYMGAGLVKNGLNHFKHYLQPIWLMAPMNVLEDFTRPLSLALRLFANILAGEVIIMVLVQLAPIGLPIPMMLFELFVAFIQAFIFAILSASYIAAVTSESH